MELVCTMQPNRFAVQVPKNVLPIKALSIAMFNGNSNEVKSTERRDEKKKARKTRIVSFSIMDVSTTNPSIYRSAKY